MQKGFFIFLLIISLTACKNETTQKDNSSLNIVTIADSDKLSNTTPTEIPEQENTNGEWRVCAIATGDLNKDNLSDSAVVLEKKVKEDNDNTFAYFKLNIFFANQQGKYDQVISTDHIISPSRYGDGESLDTITINRNTLIIDYSLLRGYYKHIFRYQDNSFELIGFSYSSSDGNGQMYSIECNLSTGRFKKVEENYETGEIINKRDTMINFKPLPKMETIPHPDSIMSMFMEL